MRGASLVSNFGQGQILMWVLTCNRHGCKMTSSMNSWKSEAQYIKSRCGFCNENFDKWQDRVDHIAKEFRNGANMKDWKGCRGLDSHIAAQVTNAMPPYLIANESKSPLPFSASNAASMNVSAGLSVSDPFRREMSVF